MYSRYANPKELIALYIKNRRFGKFVEKLIASEEKRKRQEAEKDNEQKLWLMYVHSMPFGKSFNDWKDECIKGSPGSGATVKKDADMTDADIEEILNDLFPGK